MAKVKLTDDRSTYWVATGTNTPSKYGDYRYYWKFYYEQTDDNKKNNTSKLIIDQYIQVYFTESHPDDWMASGYTYYPSSSGNISIDGTWQTAKSNAQGTIQLGEAYNLYYQTTYTKTISHNADGTRSFKWQGTGFGKYTAVSTYSFPQILRPTVIGSVANFDIDNGVNIPVTKYVSSYYNVLEIYSGDIIFKTINDFTKDISVNTNVSIPVTFTETELDNIYTKIPNGENATFTFKLTTYTNSAKTTKIGDSTKTATGNFTIQLPSVYGGICTDAFDGNVDLTGDATKQTIIKGQSYIKIEIPTNMQAVANTRKATIAEYVVDDVHIPYNANGVSKPLSTSNSSKDHVVIYAVDSRGTSSLPYTQKFTKYIDYNRVSLNTKNYKFERQNNGISRFIDTSFEGTWFSGNFGAKQNSLTPFVYYRVNEGQTWNDLNEFVDGASVGRLDMSKLDTSTPGVFKYNGPIMSAESDTGFDIKNSYDMFFGFKDELSNEGFTLTINYGEPAAAVYKNKMALGGPYDEQLGGTQMWGDVYLNGNPLSAIFPVGSIYMSVLDTDPGALFGGTWERLQNMFLFGASDTHPAGESGGSEEVTLTEAQMPKHNHVQTSRDPSADTLNPAGVGKDNSDRVGPGTYQTTVSYQNANQQKWASGWTMNTHSRGNSEAHNNMPPYLSVYMWKRTA